jgi:hypothetical protein
MQYTHLEPIILTVGGEGIKVHVPFHSKTSNSLLIASLQLGCLMALE